MHVGVWALFWFTPLWGSGRIWIWGRSEFRLGGPVLHSKLKKVSIREQVFMGQQFNMSWCFHVPSECPLKWCRAVRPLHCLHIEFQDVGLMRERRKRKKLLLVLFWRCSTN